MTLPLALTSTQRLAQTWPFGRAILDTTLNQWFQGDGVTLGGKAVTISSTTALTNTIGQKLRRLAANAKATNPWNKPVMRAPLPWQPNAAYVIGQMVVNGGHIFTCVVAGTSAGAGGPTALDTTGSTDGTVTWLYFLENNVTTDPQTGASQTNWAASTSYSLGNQVINAGNVYGCVAAAVYTFTVSGVTVTPTAGAVYTNNSKTFTVVSASITGGNGTIVCAGTGAPASSGTLTKSSGTGDATITFASVATANTSAGSGGPTTTSNQIVDNGIIWTYLGAYVASPYVETFPTLSFSTSPPVAPLNQYYYSGFRDFFSAIRAFPLVGGSGYVVGDQITLATGNGTAVTSTVLQVTSVNAGSITGCKIITPGTYTLLQQNNSWWSQGSTTGSGTGATFFVSFTGPGWCNLYNAAPAYQQGGGTWGIVDQWQPTNNARSFITHWWMEFYSDSEQVIILPNQSFNATHSLIVIDDIMYSYDLQSYANTQVAQYWTFDFTNAGGKKRRHFKIYANSGNIPAVIVNQNSTVWPPDKEDNVTAVCISDSIWAGAGPGPFVGGNSTSLQMLVNGLGWKTVIDLVQGGTGYINRGTSPGVASDNFAYRIPQGLAYNPDIWVLMGSTNDMSSTPTAITAAVTSFIAQVRSGGSQAPIVLMGLWPINDSRVAATESAVLAAATSDPLNLTFPIPLYNDPYFPWITGSWNNNPAPSGRSNPQALNNTSYIYTGDNTHPPDIGTIYLGNRGANAIRNDVLPYIP